jgi:CO dehydrogenase/acetyl-CoA synthase delta subunit
MSGARRLNLPQRIAVRADDHGAPQEVGGREVDSVRESWLVEDSWWTERPLRRRYWEIVTVCGRNEIVFCDLISRRWWKQQS